MAIGELARVTLEARRHSAHDYLRKVLERCELNVVNRADELKVHNKIVYRYDDLDLYALDVNNQILIGFHVDDKLGRSRPQRTTDNTFAEGDAVKCLWISGLRHEPEPVDRLVVHR
ncbi:hypothetical protein BMS3Bbin02_01576 [bacterium BMS3Bbin02]|nr:hypothetical protein BMS3Bbin02_01576 [bacterium BMS3Bbin02]